MKNIVFTDKGIANIVFKDKELNITGFQAYGFNDLKNELYLIWYENIYLKLFGIKLPYTIGKEIKKTQVFNLDNMLSYSIE